MDDGGDLHGHVVAHDVGVELLPVGVTCLGAGAGRGRSSGRG